MKMALLTLAFSAGSPQFGASMSMCAEIAPVHQRAAVMATVSALLGVAGLISPFVTGRLVDVYGDSGFDMSFAITAALMMVGGIVALVLARPDRDGARLRAQAMKP
jgi:MFS family permease